MTSKIQSKIYTTIEKLESLKSIHRHFQETEKNLSDYERKLEKMNKQLEKELNDISKLVIELKTATDLLTQLWYFFLCT